MTTKYSLVFTVFRLSKGYMKLHIIWGPFHCAVLSQMGGGVSSDWLWEAAGWVAEGRRVICLLERGKGGLYKVLTALPAPQARAVPEHPESRQHLELRPAAEGHRQPAGAVRLSRELEP